MATLGDIDILDEPNALIDDSGPVMTDEEFDAQSVLDGIDDDPSPECNCDLPEGTPHVCSEERQADGAIEFLDMNDYDPTPYCNCGCCPQGDVTCVRDD